MTSSRKANAAVAATTLLACLAATVALPYVAILAHGALGSSLFGFVLFYSTQYIFPFTHVVVGHDDRRLGVFSDRSALLLTSVQWVVVAAVFGWCFRNDARLRRIVPFALLTLLAVTIAVSVVIAACGATIEIDSL